MRALITGATKGIGKAIATKLATNGFDLVLLARDTAGLNKLKEALAVNGNQVLAYSVDCSNKNEILDFLKRSEKDFGFVDVLVNNVGLFLPGALLDEADEAFELQQSLNVNASYYLSKFFARKMREACLGHIFNICSVASKEPVLNAGSYSVTKAALLSLNNVLRQELAAYNVKVTAVLPGSTKTASWDGTTIPDDKFVQPEDIAQTLYGILQMSKGANVEEVVIKPLNF